MPRETQIRRTAVTSSELTPPVGPFSQAIEVGGFIYFSGQVGQDPTTGKLVAGGIAAETERVFQNLSAALQGGAKRLAHAGCAPRCLPKTLSSPAPRGSMSAKRCKPMENGLRRQFNCTCNLPTMKFHLYQFHSGKDDVQCQRFLYKCCGHYF